MATKVIVPPRKYRYSSASVNPESRAGVAITAKNSNAPDNNNVFAFCFNEASKNIPEFQKYLYEIENVIPRIGKTIYILKTFSLGDTSVVAAINSDNKNLTATAESFSRASPAAGQQKTTIARWALKVYNLKFDTFHQYYEMMRDKLFHENLYKLGICSKLHYDFVCQTHGFQVFSYFDRQIYGPVYKSKLINTYVAPEVLLPHKKCYDELQTTGLYDVYDFMDIKIRNLDAIVEYWNKIEKDGDFHHFIMPHDIRRAIQLIDFLSKKGWIHGDCHVNNFMYSDSVNQKGAEGQRQNGAEGQRQNGAEGQRQNGAEGQRSKVPKGQNSKEATSEKMYMIDGGRSGDFDSIVPYLYLFDAIDKPYTNFNKEEQLFITQFYDIIYFFWMVFYFEHRNTMRVGVLVPKQNVLTAYRFPYRYLLTRVSANNYVKFLSFVTNLRTIEELTQVYLLAVLDNTLAKNKK